ncbi:MAG: DNA polymerase II large subunit [Candidatus Micrarchaeota archaeon]|nr:DNA polymerase II large subunit [Candidatus Micrarchaeota archaeon]
MNTQNYFIILKAELQKAYAISSEARSKGFDPEKEVEVKIAPDVAARVEGIVGPKGIAEIIRSMEKQGISREDVAFEIAKKLASGEIIKGTKEQLVEQAVRTGLGILTEGVLVAPTEGIAKVRVKNNPDGTDYVAVYYSGPIRSAGGTAVALSVLLADVARRVVGIGDYRATDTQIERYNEEVNIYESRVAHLQYKPPEEDVKWVVQNCPVCIDGDPTEEIEVSTFRSVPGVETNRIRGGVPLVICEGIAQKCAKVFKYTKKLNLGWTWLEKIIKVSKKEDKVDIKVDFTYLEGMVAGRPVFAYPSRMGGFRLRYGKSRTNSLMAKNIHPATMILLSNFLAYGTHMKIERPGKGCVIAGHELLEPPVVRLKNGTVTKVHTIEHAENLENQVSEVLFLGDMLITYGDFLKSNYPLIPSAWCDEWFVKELESKGVQQINLSTAKDAFEFSRKYEVPLLPLFTYNWGDLKKEELGKLADWLCKVNLQLNENGELQEATIDNAPEKSYLENLLVEHKLADGKVILESDNAYAVLNTLGLLNQTIISMDKFTAAFSKYNSVFEILKECSGIEIKNKCPSYIGARMGRPEKAKERKMDGSPHVLFPTGSQKNRSIAKVYKTIKGKDIEKTINLELARMRCMNCNSLTFYARCETCGGAARLERACVKCSKATDSEIHCDEKTIIYDRRPINIISILENTKKKLGFMPEDVKGIKGLSNPERFPERVEKGFFRSKHDVYVFRDGTSRFDATDIPITHFIPKEIGVTIEKLRTLGYDKDYFGNELTKDDQLVTMYHQDIILADNGADYFMKVANFMDDMLVNLYGLQSFYNVKKKDDLIGHLCAALSPHTSAAVLCRIIGFTRANVGYGHPYFHTVKRRNCFHPQTRILIESSKNKKYKILEVTLEDITENLLGAKNARIKVLDNDTIRVESEEELFVHSIDKSSKQIVKRKIKCFMKTKAPEYWIRIMTKNGREMSVTPDHNILCIENGIMKSIEASNVVLGQKIPIRDKSKKSFILEPIVKIEKFIEVKNAYCLDIETESDELVEKNVLLNNGIFCIRCDGDEDCVMMLLDALINFSRHYLDERRGGTMDTPLVLSPTIDPKEVDDEAHCIEMVTSYPLEFYHATERFALPSEVKIKTVKDVLGKDEQFDIPLTHLGGYIDKGNIRTAYVLLDSIPDKIKVQFELHERLRGVDQKDAAERLILSHFIPDLYGNLRSFSRQTFRCGNCNESFRRVPLAGKCYRCGGNLLLTINKGGIQKYLEISRGIIDRYQLPDYLKQRIDLLDKEIKSIFEDDKIKQLGLADFI